MRVEARDLPRMLDKGVIQSPVIRDVQQGFQALEVDGDKFLLIPHEGDDQQIHVEIIKQEGALLVSTKTVEKGGAGEIPNSAIDSGTFESIPLTLRVNRPWYLVYGADRMYRITYLGSSGIRSDIQGIGGRFRLETSTRQISTRTIEPQVNLLQTMQTNFRERHARRGG